MHGKFLGPLRVEHCFVPIPNQSPLTVCTLSIMPVLTGTRMDNDTPSRSKSIPP